MFFKSIRISLRAALLAGAALFLGAAFTLSAPAQLQSSPASGRSAIEEVLKRLNRSHSLGQVAISPDGKLLAWTERTKGGAEIHLAPLGDLFKGGPVEGERVTAATRPEQHCHEGKIVWSPDAKSLIFISDCAKPNQPDLYILLLDGSPARRLTELKGYVEAPAFSPDGTRVAFLYVEDATRPAGALAAMKLQTGVIGEGSAEIERVAIVRVNAAKPEITEWATPADLHVYEFDWRPDGHGLAYIAADPPGENNWWVAKLYTRNVDPPWVATGQPCPSNGDCLQLRSILDPTAAPGPLHGLQIAVPRFSPDGKQIAFIGGLMSDQGSTGGDIYLIPTTGGEPKDVTPNRPASPAYIAWLDDHTLGISEHFGGSSRIAVLDLATGKDDPDVNITLPETIHAGDDSMSVSLSKTGNIALIRQSFARPPELWAGPSDNLQQISHLNDAIQPAWGKAESIDYTSDGLPIQGWLLYPANFDPSKKYPLIVSVHGGPSSALTPRWPGATYSAIPLSALGYFVFLPNPRGSFGQGERFTQANVKDFGYVDLRDILAGVDLIEKRFPIDRDREGITGWSYGGFMTMFAVTQTTRFRAAVAGAGLSNWQSYYGENSIDQWMLPFFGASVYDDPAVYARSSPINFIKKVKTPTLLLVGDRDGECPAPQSFEFWHALRAQGVPAQLVVYPGEGHHFADPAHQRDLLRRTIGWFQAQMPAK